MRLNLSHGAHFKRGLTEILIDINHVRNQDFCWGGTQFQKILKKISKNFQKIVK